jgi:hypothetical protein
MEYGQQIKGQISFIGDFQVFKFVGQAGESIAVNMYQEGAASLYPYVRFFDPNNNQLNDAHSEVSSDQLLASTLNVSGTYTIVLSGWGNTTGGYRLWVEKKK